MIFIELWVSKTVNSLAATNCHNTIYKIFFVIVILWVKNFGVASLYLITYQKSSMSLIICNLRQAKKIVQNTKKKFCRTFGELTSNHFILSHEAGFYEITTRKVYSPILRIYELSKVPRCFFWSNHFYFLIFQQSNITSSGFRLLRLELALVHPSPACWLTISGSVGPRSSS